MNFSWQGADDSANQLFRVIATIMGHDERLLAFLFEQDRPRLRMRAGVLREEAWRFSEEEQLVIRVALDIWCGSGHVQLWELIEAWGNPQWEAFSAAICKLPVK